MKRTLSLLLALFLSLSLFSCTYRSQEPPKQDTTPEESDKVETAVPSGTKNYGIVADSIRAYYSPDVDYEVFILERDGKFGVINHKGEILVEPTWDRAELANTAATDVEWSSGEVKIHLSMDDGDPTDGVFVNADGSLTPGFPGGFGAHSHYEAYWDVEQNEPRIFWIGEGEAEDRGTDVSAYVARIRRCTYYADNAHTSPKMIPVQAISSYSFTDNDADVGGQKLSVTREKDGLYALLSLETGKLITDFVYEDYDRQGEVNRAIAMKKNGAWGYVDTIGREITRFGFLPCYTETVWGDDGWEEVAAFYPNTRSNLITICEGELYGILEASEGRIYVIPAYTDISMPNTSGWFYAKVADGTWTAVNAFENYKR